MKIDRIQKKVLLATAVALAMWSSGALAVAYNIEPTQIMVLGTLQSQSVTLGTMNSAMANTSSQMSNMNQYLQTGFNGNGLLPLLSSINDKMGKSNADDSQAGLNENMAARDRIYESAMMGMKSGLTPTQEQFKRSCIEITSALTNGQGHGAAGGASSVFRGVREHAAANEQRMLTPRDASSRLADNVRGRQGKGFCSDVDIKNGFPGCTEIGAFPAADIRATTLTMGATSVPSDPTNGSLSPEQQDAAMAVINNTLPMPPAIPQGVALDSPEGKAHLAYLNKFVTRQSFSRDAMASIVQAHAELPITANGSSDASPAIQNWRAKEASWKRVFGPQMAFPANPSERDMLRHEAYRYTSDPALRTYIEKLSNGAPNVVGELGVMLKEIIKIEAINAKLQYQQLERQEQTNMLLAQILNQQMDPLTSEGLSGSASKISSSRTGQAK